MFHPVSTWTRVRSGEHLSLLCASDEAASVSTNFATCLSDMARTRSPQSRPTATFLRPSSCSTQAQTRATTTSDMMVIRTDRRPRSTSAEPNRQGRTPHQNGMTGVSGHRPCLSLIALPDTTTCQSASYQDSKSKVSRLGDSGRVFGPASGHEPLGSHHCMSTQNVVEHEADADLERSDRKLP